MKKHKHHFRRCHLCQGITESVGAPVSRCMHCGKPMAPFYFFNEAEVAPWSEHGLRPDNECKPGERLPVRGFTAYW